MSGSRSLGLMLFGGTLAWGGPAAGAAADPGSAAAAVDLLRTVPTVVAVSSAVTGTSDKPEFLVDGDLETAWNSQSGDLRGWVAVRIPREVKVTAVKLTAGYPKVKPKGDLFVMNHRIRKVRVLRDNQLVGEFPLDPEQRGLQTLPVQLAGGDLRIEVMETVVGTKPGWRELCISELQVMGTVPPAAPPAAGATAAGPAAVVRPVVRVGSLDAGTRKGPLALGALAGPFESAEAFAKGQGGALREPKLLVEIPSIAAASGPFLAVRVVAVGAQGCRLGVQTFRGWFFSPELASCPSATAESSAKGTAGAESGLFAVSQLRLFPGVAGQSPVLLAELLTESAAAGSTSGSCSANLYICGIGSSGSPSCTSALPMGDGSGGSCSTLDGESAWSWRYRGAWLPTGQLGVDLDENASMGPTECEGRRRECARSDKEKRRQIRDSVPDEAKALAKAKAVVFP